MSRVVGSGGGCVGRGDGRGLEGTERRRVLYWLRVWFILEGLRLVKVVVMKILLCSVRIGGGMINVMRGRRRNVRCVAIRTDGSGARRMMVRMVIMMMIGRGHVDTAVTTRHFFVGS